jgi:hypothetical protein
LENAKNEIKRFIIVITLAILSAFLLAFLSIYFYSPSNLYAAKKALLAPEVIKEINFKDKHPQTGQNVQFIFDQTEFSYYDRAKREQKRIGVSDKAYEEFYHLAASEQSLKSLNEETVQIFNDPHSAMLVINFRTVTPSQTPVSKVFQVVQLVPEDYFRIQLHEGRGGDEWAYFYQPGIYNSAMRLFTKN